MTAMSSMAALAALTTLASLTLTLSLTAAEETISQNGADAAHDLRLGLALALVKKLAIPGTQAQAFARLWVRTTLWNFVPE